MDTARALRIEALLASGPVVPAPALVVDPVPYTVEGMMDRARRFIATSDPARRYLEGVCVRGGRAWASNGRAVASLPLVDGVPEGLHLYGAGWAEKGHDYPDVAKVIASLDLRADAAVAVDARYFRALAEHAVASVPSSSQNGYPCPAVVLRREEGRLELGSAILTMRSRDSRRLRGFVVAGQTTAGEPVIVDARALIPALIGCGPAVGLSISFQRFSPLLVVRADGEEHVVMPMRQSPP